MCIVYGARTEYAFIIKFCFRWNNKYKEWLDSVDHGLILASAKINEMRVYLQRNQNPTVIQSLNSIYQLNPIENEPIFKCKITKETVFHNFRPPHLVRMFMRCDVLSFANKYMIVEKVEASIIINPSRFRIEGRQTKPLNSPWSSTFIGSTLQKPNQKKSTHFFPNFIIHSIQ